MFSFLLSLAGVLRASEPVPPSEPPASATESARSMLPVELQGKWFFCPVQNYQPFVDLAVLDCSPINLPSGWESVSPDYDGYGLLYSYFDLPENLPNLPLAIYFERIRDADKVFINGRIIGETGAFPPAFDKAVLFTRIYPIPREYLNLQAQNEVRVWVFNDARPGGITHSIPTIDSQFKLIEHRYWKNIQAFSFMLVMAIFAVLHLIYFIFHRKFKDNLVYACMLFCWSAYVVTFSDILLSSSLSLTMSFRINVALFFAIFSFFPIFVYSFFHHKIPVFMRVIIGLPLLLIPFCFLLPEPKLLYYPLELVEVLTLPALIFVFSLLVRSIRAKLPYAKVMAVAVTLYVVIGGFDILVDFTHRFELEALMPYTPWALLLVILAFTIIMAHKNLVYYRDATVDRLTMTLRYPEFLQRLQMEIFRSQREQKPLVVIMLDLDDFKTVNDSFGHIQGDKLLVMVADALKHQLRHFDLLGRYGGDEFLVAAILDSRQEIRNFAGRLHQQINQLSFELKKENHLISATFGAVIHAPNDEALPEDMVKAADDLLIAAKAKGKGKIEWQPVGLKAGKPEPASS